jgi:hypothetical protein
MVDESSEKPVGDVLHAARANWASGPVNAHNPLGPIADGRFGPASINLGREILRPEKPRAGDLGDQTDRFGPTA